MAYSNNPMVQARIHQARIKKQQQLRMTASASYLQGVRAGAAAARELIEEGFETVYDFKSLVLYRLNLIEADDRILLGSDVDKPHFEILEAAKKLLTTDTPTDDQYITASVPLARTADEAWVLHRELTEIYRDDLPEARRAKLAAAISERFPH